MQPLSHYLQKFRANPKLAEVRDDELRVAFLSSFTINGLPETLTVVADEQKIAVRTYTGIYGQYSQEILGDGPLYAFDPHAVVLMLDAQFILGEDLHDPYANPSDARDGQINSALQNLIELKNALMSKSKTLLIVHTIASPISSPLGIHESNEVSGLKEKIEDFNMRLRTQFRNENRVFIFDYVGWSSRFGTERLFDPKLYYLGDIRINPQYFGELAKAYMPYIRALAKKAKKCIVLDLDNTIWGGVIGEDGLDGIKLGPTPEGRPFMDFQRRLLALWRRGVILAVNSKNNSADALEVFKKHPYSILKEEHFAAMEINWEDKIANMSRLAETINIGLDSMLFLDDDALNRTIVQEVLPEVLTPEFPVDPAYLPGFLDELQFFDTLSLTDEDRARGTMYAQERKREEFRTSTSDLESYLKGMQIEVKIEEAAPGAFPRIAQLTQKTNQFNTTTKRFTEAELVNMQDHLIFAASVKDRFGDSGLTGVAIIDKKPDTWNLECVLFSCRVIGRGAEDALLSIISSKAKQAGASKLVGRIIPTKKNAPVRDYYAKNGFTKVQDGEEEIWGYHLTTPIKPPEYLTITNI